MTEDRSRVRVLLVSPVPPPYGGMALQCQQLEKGLRNEGIEASTFATNFALPSALRIAERIPGVRTILRAILIWFKLWPEVRKSDVVHVLAASWWYFFLSVVPAVTVGRLCRKRVVLNYRGGEAREFFRTYGWLASPVFRMAGVITVPSEFLASVIRERFGVAVSIVPNLLDCRLFPYLERATIQPKMLVTRHLEKMYDIESVLRAFREVQQRYPEASLWIAGGGSQGGYLRDLAAQWALKNVRFLGAVAHRDLPGVYAECDIYLNASTVDNFPGALLEASAAGLVVVTTGAGGIPFIYDHGKNALLVEPGDWRGLASAVENVLENPSMALELARAGTAIVRACDWTEVRKRLLEAYGICPAVALDQGLSGARCIAG